jgi:F0F1-type ATP synthase assembly protein I
MKTYKTRTNGMISEALRQVAPYTHLGWQLFATVALFTAIGWGVDKLLNISPIGIIIFSVGGIVIGLYSMLKSAKDLSEKRK